ncbi:DUF5689 domain-containing protein [Pedobacter sp.]
MKKLSNLVSFLSLALIVTIIVSCDKNNYKGGEPSPILNIELLRDLYKGTDLNLAPNVIYNAQHIGGVVISDYSGNNIPSNLLIIQSARGYRGWRGMAIDLGAAEASKYQPGDSVHVNIQGSTLKRVNGILQIVGADASKVQKIATNRNIVIASASAVAVKNNPNAYEGRLVTVYSCNFDPNIGVEKLEGVKDFNDGSGDMQTNISATSDLKDDFLPYSANVTGILLGSTSDKMNLYPRKKSDFVATSIIVDPNVPLGETPAIISGYAANISGGDGDYEYVQFMATQDLDFRRTPFSVIFCRNAGNTSPYPNAAPQEGWLTGGNRTYKFNITRGTVAKGTFFYVGGFKFINGAGSTDIAQANWAASKQYSKDKGDDDIGDPTSGMMPNSGNPAGIAIFNTANVTATTAPIDVVFFGTTSSYVYQAATGTTPAYGYLIANNDYYKKVNGTTPQPLYKQGNNSNRFTSIGTEGIFVKMGGVFKISTNTWLTKRTTTNFQMITTTPLSDIETTGVTQLQN